MTLLVDANEHRNHPDLTLLLKQSLEVQIGDYNQSPNGGVCYPDLTASGGELLVGGNRKTVFEVLANLDKVVEQLQREIAGPCERLQLYVEGMMRPSGTGMMAYTLDWNRAKEFQNGYGTVPYSSRYFAVNPKHVQNTLTRLEWLGVQVILTTDIQDTAAKLIAMHEMVMRNEPNKVLDRLIKQEFHIQALDPIERAMSLSLMGIINGGVGEEIALGLAKYFNSLYDLIEHWRAGLSISEITIRSGRRVGHAAEQKLKRALGYVEQGSLVAVNSTGHG